MSFLVPVLDDVGCRCRYYAVVVIRYTYENRLLRPVQVRNLFLTERAEYGRIMLIADSWPLQVSARPGRAVQHNFETRRQALSVFVAFSPGRASIPDDPRSLGWELTSYQSSHKVGPELCDGGV